MKDYANFLGRFAQFAEERSIPWAVVGSHAMVAHAALAGVPPKREAHDLDLIVFLPRIRDAEFREWLGRRSKWVYEKLGLGAIHFWCDDGSQVDLFIKPDTAEIDRAVCGEVLGGIYRIACRDDVLRAVAQWAEGAKDSKHEKHCDQLKYQGDADWIGSILNS